MRKLKPVIFAVAALFAVTLCAGYAQADVMYSLSTPNSALTGYPTPFGTVTVSLTSTDHATVTFDASSTASYQYLFGGQGAAAVNVNSSDFSMSGITGTSLPSFDSFQLANHYTAPGGGGVDGFGTFNATVDLFDGYTHALNQISFTLTNSSSTHWTSADQVLTANGNDALVAAHIFITSYPADSSNGAIVTGYAAGGPPGTTVHVPEPATVFLIGLGLICLAGLRKKIPTI